MFIKYGRPAPVPMSTASNPSANRSSIVRVFPMTALQIISTPIFLRISISLSITSIGSLNLGIP